jgi:hypothetical protein
MIWPRFWLATLGLETNVSSWKEGEEKECLGWRGEKNHSAWTRLSFRFGPENLRIEEEKKHGGRQLGKRNWNREWGGNVQDGELDVDCWGFVFPMKGVWFFKFWDPMTLNLVLEWPNKWKTWKSTSDGNWKKGRVRLKRQFSVAVVSDERKKEGVSRVDWRKDRNGRIFKGWSEMEKPFSC